MFRQKKPANAGRGGLPYGVSWQGHKEDTNGTPTPQDLRARWIVQRFALSPAVAALVATLAFEGRAAR